MALASIGTYRPLAILNQYMPQGQSTVGVQNDMPTRTVPEAEKLPVPDGFATIEAIPPFGTPGWIKHKGLTGTSDTHT